jgi:hypothetical protein
MTTSVKQYFRNATEIVETFKRSLCPNAVTIPSDFTVKEVEDWVIARGFDLYRPAPGTYDIACGQEDGVIVLGFGSPIDAVEFKIRFG